MKRNTYGTLIEKKELNETVMTVWNYGIGIWAESEKKDRFCRKELQYILSFKIGDIIKDFRADKELYFQLNVGDDGRIEYKGEKLIAFEHN